MPYSSKVTRIWISFSLPSLILAVRYRFMCSAIKSLPHFLSIPSCRSGSSIMVGASANPRKLQLYSSSFSLVRPRPSAFPFDKQSKNSLFSFLKLIIDGTKNLNKIVESEHSLHCFIIRVCNNVEDILSLYHRLLCLNHCHAIACPD